LNKLLINTTTEFKQEKQELTAKFTAELQAKKQKCEHLQSEVDRLQAELDSLIFNSDSQLKQLKDKVK